MTNYSKKLNGSEYIKKLFFQVRKQITEVIQENVKRYHQDHPIREIITNAPRSKASK
jgi:hypothetical protein